MLLKRIHGRPADAREDGQCLLRQFLFLAPLYGFFDKAWPIKAKVPFHRFSMKVMMASRNSAVPVVLSAIAFLAASRRFSRCPAAMAMAGFDNPNYSPKRMSVRALTSLMGMWALPPIDNAMVLYPYNVADTAS